MDKKFASGLRAINISKDIKKQLLRNNIELEKLTKLLSDSIYEKYATYEQKNVALESQAAFLSRLKQHVNEQIEIIKNYQVPTFEGQLADDPALKRNSDILKTTVKNVINSFTQSANDIENAAKTIDLEYKKWSQSYIAEKKKYEEHVRKSGGDRKIVENKRLRILKEIEDLKKRQNALEEETKNLKLTTKSRDDVIKKLFNIYDEYTKERKDKCQKFEKESNGRLQIRIKESTNVDEFKKQLTSLKKGSYLKDSEIEDICSAISPYDFIMAVLRYEATKERIHINIISEKTGIDIDRIYLLCDFLLSQVKYEELLRLQYHARPQDRPEIKFRLNNKKYELVRDISVGQKCTAMLIMALSDGTFPIIIDQPEDSLDVRSVWEDMCLKIRKGKEKRQFIFTTHNSSLAVASDTDKYTIVESDANRGRVIMSGAIDSTNLKNQIIDYLEGGYDTYQTKADKYGVKSSKKKL